MKELMRTVKQTFQVGWHGILGYNIYSVVAGIVGMIIVFIIMKTEGDEASYAAIGSLLTLMFGAMIVIVVGIISVQMDFNVAISMGKTRKYYVPAQYLLYMASWALCLGIATILALVEEYLYPSLYPNAESEISMMFLVSEPGITFGLLLLVPAVIMLAGSLVLKFGMKSFWVLWIIWMFGCVGLPRIISAAEDAPDSFWGRAGVAFVNFFKNMSGTEIGIGMMVLAIAGLATSFLLLRKQRVTA